MRPCWSVFAITLSFVAVGSGATPIFELPSGITPRKHTLELTIDPSEPAMEGRMEIAIEVGAPTSQIWLNARNITPRDATINNQAVKVLAEGGEFLGLEMSSPLPTGSATIVIRFQSTLDDKLAVGAYRRKVGGDWYAYTTFTPIEARRAFPCFDEPRYKTPWEITLRVPKEDGAFSNSREQSSTIEGGFKTVHFETTPPLAAEVVAFAVGPFDVLDGGVAGRASVPIRVIVAKGHSVEGTAAARNTVMVLPRIEAYTGIPYPFAKLDHLAIPDIEFSAVENPGLITYRANALQMPANSDLTSTRRLRLLEAHEIVHQWFGNLVTQSDWKDVWLSEGFATWLADKVMDLEQPGRTHLAAILTRERIMEADTAKARVVRTPIGSRDASMEIYNRFVYDKAAAVLMMLERWMGEDQFRAGLQGYLKAHPYGNASSDDLAGALREASGKDPAPVLHALLDSGGVPVLQGEVECEKDGATLEIKQASLSVFPVCWRTSAGASGCDVLDTLAKSIRLPSCPSWTYLNAGGTGYYRTTWTAGTLAQLHLGELSPPERLTLVNDLHAQTTDLSAARAMLERLRNDADTDIAQAARTALK